MRVFGETGPSAMLCATSHLLLAQSPEEQELPEQFWDACSDLQLHEMEVMFQVTWTAAREI